MWGSSTPHFTVEEAKGQLQTYLDTHTVDFPGGPVVKNPPANAEDMGSIPGLGRFHMLHADQLSPSTSITEPACLEPVLGHKRSHRNEKYGSWN